MLAAEQLAFAQAGSRGQAVPRSCFKPLDARQALRQRPHGDPGPSAIAYLGEIAPGYLARLARDHQRRGPAPGQPHRHGGRADPADTRGPRAPNTYYEALKTYGRTFARVVPTTRHRGQGAGAGDAGAGGQEALRRRRRQPLRRRRSPLAVRTGRRPARWPHHGPATPRASEPPAPTALFFGASSPAAAAATLFAAVARAAPEREAVRPLGARRPDVRRRRSARQAEPLRLRPGFPAQRPDPGRPSSSSPPFKAATGHPPSPEAIFGYEAMAAVLDVLRKAGTPANDRVERGAGLPRDQQPELRARHLLDQCQRRHEPRAVRVQPLARGRLVPFAFAYTAGVSRRRRRGR